MRSIIFASLTVSLIACEKPQKAGEGDGSSKSSSGRTVIQNKGSDTLVNVAQAWAETYKTVDANVAIAVTGIVFWERLFLRRLQEVAPERDRVSREPRVYTNAG